jgi:hypothetical protein
VVHPTVCHFCGAVPVSSVRRSRKYNCHDVAVPIIFGGAVPVAVDGDFSLAIRRRCSCSYQTEVFPQLSEGDVSEANLQRCS